MVSTHHSWLHKHSTYNLSQPIKTSFTSLLHLHDVIDLGESVVLLEDLVLGHGLAGVLIGVADEHARRRVAPQRAALALERAPRRELPLAAAIPPHVVDLHAEAVILLPFRVEEAMAGAEGETAHDAESHCRDIL